MIFGAENWVLNLKYYWVIYKKVQKRIIAMKWFISGDATKQPDEIKFQMKRTEGEFQ